jgi:hypothetical protein
MGCLRRLRPAKAGRLLHWWLPYRLRKQPSRKQNLRADILLRRLARFRCRRCHIWRSHDLRRYLAHIPRARRDSERSLHQQSNSELPACWISPWDLPECSLKLVTLWKERPIRRSRSRSTALRITRKRWACCSISKESLLRTPSTATTASRQQPDDSVYALPEALSCVRSSNKKGAGFPASCLSYRSAYEELSR